MAPMLRLSRGVRAGWCRGGGSTAAALGHRRTEGHPAVGAMAYARSGTARTVGPSTAPCGLVRGTPLRATGGGGCRPARAWCGAPPPGPTPPPSLHALAARPHRRGGRRYRPLCLSSVVWYSPDVGRASANGACGSALSGLAAVFFSVLLFIRFARPLPADLRPWPRLRCLSARPASRNRCARHPRKSTAGGCRCPPAVAAAAAAASSRSSTSGGIDRRGLARRRHVPRA